MRLRAAIDVQLAEMAAVDDDEDKLKPSSTCFTMTEYDAW